MLHRHVPLLDICRTDGFCGHAVYPINNAITCFS